MSRRYSKQARNRVRDFVELQITDYHSNRRALADYRAQSIPSAVPKYGGTGGGHGGDSRPTELIGVRMASDQYIEHLTRSVAAVGLCSPGSRRRIGGSCVCDTGAVATPWSVLRKSCISARARPTANSTQSPPPSRGSWDISAFDRLG